MGTGFVDGNGLKSSLVVAAKDDNCLFCFPTKKNSVFVPYDSVKQFLT